MVLNKIGMRKDVIKIKDAQKMFETLPEGFRLSTDEISLEDVYLYYFETK